MIMVHLFLVLDRLMQGAPEEESLARRLSETFVTDVDDCLREMGVGDLAVPKKVKRAAAALEERCRAYREALRSGGDGPLAEALAATLPGLEEEGVPAARALAAYVRQARAHMARLAAGDLLAGRVTFPAAPAIGAAAPMGARQ
jgi:cytochrome b pre-mRNA-processing protein 3